MTYMSFAQVSIPGFHSHEVTLPPKSCFGNHGCRSHGRLGTFWIICASKHKPPPAGQHKQWKTHPKNILQKNKTNMSLRTLRGKGVYCGVQVHTSQPRDQPNTVARILILTCQIVVGSMTGGAACSSIQHFWGSLDFSDILEDKNNKCWFTTRSSCGFSHWTKVWQNLVAIWSHHFQAGWSCLKKGPNSPIRLLDSPMVNLSMGKPTHQYSKFRKSLSLFSFRFISVAALWWPAKSCEFPTDPMARRAARRWRLPGAQGSPWDPSRCSHGFCLRTQRIELILLKKPWGCGLIDLVVSLKSTSCNPHFANMVKVVMWQWELSQRTTYRGHTSFYEGIIPRYDTLSPNTKLIDRSKNTWNCSPWQNTFIGYLFFN